MRNIKHDIRDLTIGRIYERHKITVSYKDDINDSINSFLQSMCSRYDFKVEKIDINTSTSPEICHRADVLYSFIGVIPCLYDFVDRRIIGAGIPIDEHTMVQMKNDGPILERSLGALIQNGYIPEKGDILIL